MNCDGLLEPLNLEIAKPTAVQYQDSLQETEGEDEEPKTILELDHNMTPIPISVTIPAYAYHHQWIKMGYDNSTNYTTNYDYSYSQYPVQSPQTYYAPTIPRLPETTIELATPETPTKSNDNFSDTSNSSNVQILTEEEMWKNRVLQMERGN
jgi:hypothetical protein